MSRKPLSNEPLIEAMLKIFGARVAAEIERRRAEQVLRSSESQYREIFNAVADTFVLRDADYRVVDVNPAFLKATGLRREDVVGVDQLIVIRARSASACSSCTSAPSPASRSISKRPPPAPTARRSMSKCTACR
jgi:transcriptional regulator with PAS, ATPase and Fis domain